MQLGAAHEVEAFSLSQIKWGAVISYAAVGFNAVAGLLYTPWMVSCIGADDYALYTLAISVVNFFLLDFGLGNAATRFLSKFYAEGNRQKANQLLGLLYKLYLAIAAAIFVVLLAIYLSIDVIYANLGADQLEVFKGLYVVVALYSVISFPCMVFNGVLTSNERFVALNMCNFLQKVCAVVLIVVALLFGAGVYALVLANAATSLFFAAVKYVFIRKETDARAQLVFWDKGLLGEVAGFSGWATVVAVSSRFIFAVMPTILAVVSQSWEIALFGLASSLEGYVYTVASALGNMFAPRVSRIFYERGNSESLQDLMAKVGKIQLCIIGFIFVVFLTQGQLFVDCWMGSDYAALYYCVLLLIAPSVIELPQMVGVTAIEISGHVKWRAWTYVATAAANVVLSFALGPTYGALGCCASVCVAYLVRAALMNVAYVKKLDVKLGVFCRTVYAKWLPTAVIAVAFGGALSSFHLGSGWLELMMKVALLFLVYGFIAARLTLDEADKAMVLGRFGKKSR